MKSEMPLELTDTDIAAVAERLDAIIRDLGSVAIAFSGGVDSALVLAVSLRVLGPAAVLAVTADSASLARHELDEARQTAAALGATLVVVATHEVAVPAYQLNRGDRCYFCKRVVLSAICQVAAESGLRHVATGTHADDRRAAHRPGLAAARALSVAEPLAEAGIGKSMVRTLARSFGLPVADKPSSPCLASRIAVGIPVSVQLLGVVERAEDIVRRLLDDQRVPVVDLRVRVLPGAFRVELDKTALDRAADNAELVATLMRELGTAGLAGPGQLALYQAGSVSIFQPT